MRTNTSYPTFMLPSYALLRLQSKSYRLRARGTAEGKPLPSRPSRLSPGHLWRQARARSPAASGARAAAPPAPPAHAGPGTVPTRPTPRCPAEKAAGRAEPRSAPQLPGPSPGASRSPAPRGPPRPPLRPCALPAPPARRGPRKAGRPPALPDRKSWLGWALRREPRRRVPGEVELFFTSEEINFHIRIHQKYM
ncbi:uncharacterized protein ACIQIH_013968 [Cyanocitta cristata]